MFYGQNGETSSFQGKTWSFQKHVLKSIFPPVLLVNDFPSGNTTHIYFIRYVILCSNHFMSLTVSCIRIITSVQKIQ